ncbi:Gfo/Idh/MocA family oxidoreductase [Fulvivirgaceae bacterium BMA12]|uniref:Gfo/Idh/MocA family oxidoreductase n=1 Tax=Agaribacillus aureus TaxID=3051825 RepID=A0ABT8LGY7_9BACT|nr:Gfo/Idh/MocA family oxidoreductase [Fulvivirgaceae bacterium BMA12]
MTKINIALVGSGSIAHRHAMALRKLPDVVLKAVISRTQDNAQSFAEKYKIPEAGTEALSLSDRPDIDAILICTPNKFHAPYAKEYLLNGKDVFLEKPMAMNPAEGEELIKIAEQTGKLVLVGHMWRYDEEVLFLKRLIDKGSLGKIIKTKGYGIHENWGPEGWFTDVPLAGGGALADMGVHAIDTVRFLLGNPLPTQVYAKIGTHYGDYDVDDSGMIMITWNNGTTSIVESGWWQPHMDGPEASTQLFGTKGYASTLPTSLKFNDQNQGNEIIIPDFDKNEHCDQKIYDVQMVDFIDCIKTRTQPRADLKVGQVVLQIVAAAYQSSKEKRAINL